MFQSGPALWLILVTIGVLALGAAMAFGILRNRARTPREKVTTEAATHAQYQAEERDRIN